MTALTVQSIGTILGREIDEVVLTAAKANAMGLDAETIANSIGLERTEIEELMLGQDYKDVRLLVGADMLKERTERDANWDGVESISVRKLHRRAELENDTDTLLRIAAVANRATRRTAPPKDAGPLDPSQAGARIPLTLTRRFTERLGVDGSMTREVTQQISVLNGSAINPKFEDVRTLLTDGPRSGSNRTDSPKDASPEAMAAYHLMRRPETEHEAQHGELSSRTAHDFVEEPRRSPALDYVERVADEGSQAFSMQELLAAARRAKP